MTPQPTPSPTPSPHNRFGLDYRDAAAGLGPPPLPIIDAHAHINGAAAARIYDEVRRLYGIERTYSMTFLAEADAVQGVLGDAVRFIAMPDFANPDRAHAHGPGYLDIITQWAARGAALVKFWVAPRGRELGRDSGDPALLTLENPWRRRQIEHAASLGMSIMVHVADPDTWFAVKYKDPAFYGTKAQQYEPLERLMDEYRGVQWILAHMGGWPENLDFLDGLLERHPNASLDSSATKWVVRELSKHPVDRVLAFMRRWNGRVLFGSDIVTTDRHLTPDKSGRIVPMGDLASSPQEAFDLYASRYFALRTLWETGYDAESPIADPDLKMIDPQRYNDLSAPRLVGRRLPPDLLASLYHDAAAAILR